ncbi:MAG: hypothetical protein JW712_00225 [Dehalococcoidales bacterium]|nr:hypothetical protein [Dehalococcoidales bacterium]
MSTKANTEKMSVTLPKKLAGEIRTITSPGGISAFFTEALEHYLAYHKQKISLERGFGAWKDENHPDLAVAEDSVSYVNELREAGNDRLADTGDTGAE